MLAFASSQRWRRCLVVISEISLYARFLRLMAPLISEIFVNFAFEERIYLKMTSSTHSRFASARNNYWQRHLARTANFENILVVITGFGQPSDATLGFSVLYMEIINNIDKTLKDDMIVTLRSDSKVAIAASCFSIYAFQELKEQLSDISELRFIFTSPSIVTARAD